MNGDAWLAESDFLGHRRIVRRTKLHEPRPATSPDYRYHAFITDRVGDAVLLDVDHRRHTVVELAAPTSRKNLVSSTVPRASSTPTSPGPSWRCSPTTACVGRMRSDSVSAEPSSPSRQVSPSQVHHGAGSSHHVRSSSAPSPADQLTLGHPVGSMLCASRQSPDLNGQVRARPGTSRRIPSRIRCQHRPKRGPARPSVRQSPTASRPQ